MKMYVIVLLLIVSVSNFGCAQDNFFEDVSFLIVNYTKNYEAAKKAALATRKKLNLEYEEKIDCETDKRNGFYCEWECDCGETHDGYIPRGRSFTEDSFVSV
jgi:hypothetical protein